MAFPTKLQQNFRKDVLHSKQREEKDNVLLFLSHKGHRRGRAKPRAIHWSIAAGFPMAEEKSSNGAVRRMSEKSLHISSDRKFFH